MNNMDSQPKQPPPQEKIPKEIIDQYPYGKFPSQYTKSGQEDLRKISENRFSYTEEKNTNEKLDTNSSNINIESLLPLIQLMSNKNQNKDVMKILSQILFKDNKDMAKLFDLLSPQFKSQEIKNQSDFPDTNKIKISSLKRIDD